MEEKIISRSESDTFEYGRKLAEAAKPGEVYLLDGDLGVGKTVFTKGFGKGLGIDTPISSPTFTILKEYDEGRIPMYHFDVYRVGSEDEMEEIGFFDKIDSGDGVTLIEWACLIPGIIPDGAIRITIEKKPEEGFDYREITVQ